MRGTYRKREAWQAQSSAVDRVRKRLAFLSGAEQRVKLLKRLGGAFGAVSVTDDALRDFRGRNPDPLAVFPDALALTTLYNDANHLLVIPDLLHLAQP